MTELERCKESYRREFDRHTRTMRYLYWSWVIAVLSLLMAVGVLSGK